VRLAPALLPTIPAGSIFNNVPEAANYGIVYELNIPSSATYDTSGVPYVQDNSAMVPASSFDRIAYALELNTTNNPANDTYLWVSFTRPTNITAANAIGVPTVASGEFYHYPDGSAQSTAIASMNVFSNVAGIVTGTGIATGNIEFWPSNYGQNNQYGVPGANNGTYDFGDGGAGLSNGYGSMQLANYGASQMLFAYNNWNGGGTSDLGIGNDPSGGNPDWTFQGNAIAYMVKHLYVLVRQPADVSVTKTGPASALAGTSFSYSLTVTNTSATNDAGNVTLSDPLPTGTTFVSQAQTAGPAFSLSNAGNNITDTIADLSAGATATFTVTVAVPGTDAAGTVLTNTAAVASTTFDPVPGNNTSSVTTTVGGQADLAVQMTGTASSAPNGDIVYTITVTNHGPSAAVNALLSDTLPAETVLVSQSQTGGPAFTLSSSSSGINDTIASLPAGATATFTVTAQISFMAGSAPLSNTATIASSTTDPNPANNSATVVTAVNPILIFATGSDAGSVALVNVYNAQTQALIFSEAPFGFAFRGGVRVAVGDINGDGVPDVICAAGAGGLPEVAVYDGTTGALIRVFFAFGVTGPAGISNSPGSGVLMPFSGGLYVAAGDVNGDGLSDIVVGAGPGGGPQVEVFDGKTGAVQGNFYAFAPNFSGGVRVAVGDTAGGNLANIICGAGPGGVGPLVQLFDGRSFTSLGTLLAFGTTVFTGGVYVASGDVNGDGIDDIIVGAGAGGGPQVQVYRGGDLRLISNFYALAPGFTGGVRVGFLRNEGATQAILTAAGPSGGPQAELFDSASLASLTSFFAYAPQFTGGVFIA
jgi:uncharacterized repeat protein (TIGR01451 family)